MTRSFLKLLVIAFLATCLVPLVTVDCTHSLFGIPFSPGFIAFNVLIVGAAGIATAVFAFFLRRWYPHLDANAQKQVEFLDTFDVRYVNLAIFGSAALSLFLELAVIRWQGTIFEFFAFYKNYGLLACFAGLGLGYALSRSKDGIPLLLVFPLLCWQFVLLIGLRFGLPKRAYSLEAIPFREQLNMGWSASQ